MSGAVKQRVIAPSAPSTNAPHDPSKMAAQNGNGTAHFNTLSYPAEVTDDVNMNEVDGYVTLNVTLPSGQQAAMNIDYNTPMLDLLVSLAGRTKLNPSGLALQLLSDDTGKPLAYKPHQTIGSLGGRQVLIASKADSLKNKSSKKKQPFEMTHRFTINLPRGQKSVSRVSPVTRLSDVMMSVCKDKGFDPNKHVLQLPSQPGVPIDPSVTVGQLGTFEMNLVNLAHQERRNQALSMPDLSQVPPRDDNIPTYMPQAGESRKKKGFFSFLRSKDKKFRPNDALYNVETSSTTSHMMSAAQSRRGTFQPQQNRRGSDTGFEHNRPKSMFVVSPSDNHMEMSKSPPSKENVQSQQSVAPPARKKKRAPAPPVPGASQTVSPNKAENKQEANSLHKEPVSDAHHRVPLSNQKDVNSSVTTTSSSQSSSSRAEMLSRLHSRNSSDSSGYHELTLSGCESPEASHGVVKSKISIDTTSIESADNTNGDSGIHESPIRVSPIEEVLERSDSVALVASSYPVERDDVPKAGTLPSKKRKKAPAPPPLSTSQSEPSILSAQEGLKPFVEEVVVPDDSESTESSPHLPETMMEMDNDEVESEDEIIGDNDTGFDIDDILSNVKFDEEAAPFNPIVLSNTAEDRTAEADEDAMMMMETASIASENIEQIDVSKSERPCAFIPPPPPTEPPPLDEPEVDLEYLKDAMKPAGVDKGVGVNEDNTSLAPSSTKTSPDLARHRRLDSFSSVGSVDTIEGISLDFQMAIALGQETLAPSLDDVEVSPDGYKTEMALFVERMSKMAAENPQGEASQLNDSLSSGISAPGSDTNSDTGSVIRHLRTDSRDSRSGSEAGSVRSKDLKNVVDSEHGYLPTLDQRDEGQAQMDFAVSEEITIPVETVPPPPEFGDGGEEEDRGESSEEEIVETLEEIIIPLGPRGFDFSAAKKVSEVTTVTKESKKPDRPKDYGVFRAEPVSITPIASPVDEPVSTPHAIAPVSFVPVSSSNAQPQQQEPTEKEEFVLTTEDLSSVTFLPPKQKRSSSSSSFSKPRDLDSPVPSGTLIMEGKPKKLYLDFGDGEQVNNDINTQEIQSRVSQLNFTPRSESEADSVLEEKPITLLNAPSARITVESESSSKDLYDNGARKDSLTGSYESSVNYYDSMMDSHQQDYATESAAYASENTPDAVDYYEDRPESRASATSFDLSDQQDVLQSQYNALQQQFSQWQEQLLRNQSMLSSDTSGGMQTEQLEQLSSQMAIQQDMMMQLQSTMQALQLQQPVNGSSEHKAASIEVEQAAAAAESAPSVSAPPPPPPPPAPSTVGAVDPIRSEVKLKPVKASKVKAHPKFERQMDPREELMVAIRNFKGREKLRSVPAKEIKWIHQNR